MYNIYTYICNMNRDGNVAWEIDAYGLFSFYEKEVIKTKK